MFFYASHSMDLTLYILKDIVTYRAVIAAKKKTTNPHNFIYISYYGWPLVPSDLQFVINCLQAIFEVGKMSANVREKTQLRMRQNNKNYTNLVLAWYILTHFGNGKHFFYTLFHPLYDSTFVFHHPKKRPQFHKKMSASIVGLGTFPYELSCV